MSLKSNLEDDLKQAMLDKDEVSKRALRLALTSIKLAEVHKGETLTDPEVQAVLQKEAKSLSESIEEAQTVGRQDLVESAQADLAVINRYLPEPLSEDDIEALARTAIEEVGATSPGDMGTVMKELMPRVQGQADGKQVSRIVRELLSGT